MSKFPIYEDEIVNIEGEMYEGHVFIHSKYKKSKFSKTVYKHLLEIWLDVTEALESKGIPQVFSLIPKGDNKLMKWQEIFGMQPHLELGDSIIFRRIL